MNILRWSSWRSVDPKNDACEPDLHIGMKIHSPGPSSMILVVTPAGLRELADQLEVAIRIGEGIGVRAVGGDYLLIKPPHVQEDRKARRQKKETVAC